MPARDDLDIRILADDLTGALDSAAAFAAGDGIGVTWRLGRPPGRRIAVDTATREGGHAEAVRRHRALAEWLAGGALCFKKIDSLLRGHVVAEIAACLADGAYRRVVVAPAFPLQGRVTRAGRQWWLGPEATMVGPDLGTALAPAAQARIVVHDAETDADLDRAVAAEIGGAAPVLWVGSGGLAAALARRLGIPRRPAAVPHPPFLCLVGTDNPATAAQVARFAAHDPGGHIVVGDDVPAARRHLLARMARCAPSLVSVVASGDRRAAARAIETAFAALLAGTPRPGTLCVTGGETLRAVCERLGTKMLVTQAEIEPGLPVSQIVGGHFDGLTVLSKSGGFGDAGLFLRLGHPGSG